MIWTSCHVIGFHTLNGHKLTIGLYSLKGVLKLNLFLPKRWLPELQAILYIEPFVTPTIWAGIFIVARYKKGG